MPRPKFVLVLGAGFSTAAGLPTTPGLSKRFLSLPQCDEGVKDIEDEISLRLRQFWASVFGYRDKRFKPPALEDHFTLIDLAANTGHHLGPDYSPRRLRAIRRLSIHRVFRILNLTYSHSPDIADLLRLLSTEADFTIISTNWDVVVEKHLHACSIPYWYGPTVEPLISRRFSGDVLLLKLHGSANWVYCDSCRTLFAGEPTEGKTALDIGAYLEAEDFKALGSADALIKHVDEISMGTRRQCKLCQAQMAARVGTFSYRKDFAIQQFQTIWHSALTALRESEYWLFIGYSMPEADFEFKQILKSAELNHRQDRPARIQIVLKSDSAAANRFKRFFGVKQQAISQAGFATWFHTSSGGWLNQP